MTLLRYGAMQRYWHQHPPVHILVAGYLGYKAPRVIDQPAESNLGELISMFAGTGGKI